MMKFPALWICGFLLLVGGKGVRAWGGLFNRFSPEMLSNMGYGSHGGSSYRPQPLFQVSSFLALIYTSDISYQEDSTNAFPSDKNSKRKKKKILQL